MNIHRLCAAAREQIALDLRGTDDPQARNALLIAALYDVSRTVLPLLGAPRKSGDYLDRQSAVLGLIGFIALALIKEEVPDPRGVAVLSEVGEGCVDPLLRRKSAVYAQELLARSCAAASSPAVPAGRLCRWLVASSLASALLVYSGFRLARAPVQASLPVANAPAPLPLGTPVPAGAGCAQGGSAPTALPSDRREPGQEPAMLIVQERVPEQVVALPSEQATRVRIVNNQVLVPVTLKNGTETASLELVLDTGASRTVIHEGSAVRLNIDLNAARSSQSEVADGRVISLHTVKVDSLAVGPFVLPAAELEVIAYSGKDGGRDGLLGMDFLGKHRYQIDMEHELIRWF